MALVGPNLREDFLQIYRIGHVDRSAVSLSSVLILALRNRGFRAVLLYRMGRYCRVRGWGILATLLEMANHRLGFSEIATTADIGPGFTVWHPFGLIVGAGVRAGRNLALSMDCVLGGNMDKARPDGSQYPILGDNVLLASGAMVVGPVEVGNNVVVGANTVVTFDVPSESTVARLPSRVTRRDGTATTHRNGGKSGGPQAPVDLSELVRRLQARVESLERQVATHLDSTAADHGGEAPGTGRGGAGET